jgi:hypothetical protein
MTLFWTVEEMKRDELLGQSMIPTRQRCRRLVVLEEGSGFHLYNVRLIIIRQLKKSKYGYAEVGNFDH